jgi:hypothetical protein
MGKWVPGLPGVKRPGRVVDLPPPFSSAEVKERVELYLFSPSGPSWRALDELYLYLYLYLYLNAVYFMYS